MKRKEFTLFCTLLNTLLISKLPIEKALIVMTRAKKTVKNIRDFASYTAQELQNGSSFSSIMSANPYITVPLYYVSLFAAEEKTGDIKKTLSFISTSEIRRKESIESILRSALYPIVIMFVACTGSLLVYVYRKSFGRGIEDSVFYTGFFISSIFITLCVVIYMIIAYRIFTDSALFLFFFTFNFLLEAGFDTYTSLQFTASQYTLGSEARRKVSECASLVSRGNTFFEAASGVNFFPETFLMLCEYAQESGDIKQTVNYVYNEDLKKTDEKRKIFISVSEPCMIVCAGIYLLILVQYTVLPVLTNFGGVL